MCGRLPNTRLETGRGNGAAELLAEERWCAGNGASEFRARESVAIGDWVRAEDCSPWLNGTPTVNSRLLAKTAGLGTRRRTHMNPTVSIDSPARHSLAHNSLAPKNRRSRFPCPSFSDAEGTMPGESRLCPTASVDRAGYRGARPPYCGSPRYTPLRSPQPPLPGLPSDLQY
jgi:hypothetical protein